MTTEAKEPNDVSPVQEDVILDATHPELNFFAELAILNVGEHIEEKNGYSYLSWAHAVKELKKRHLDTKIIVKRFPEPEYGGLLVPYLRTPLGFFVEVEVIVNGYSVSEPFPVLDNRNKPIAKPTVFDINNSIQRAKVKAIAGHGLGLYIYAGEDVPSDENKPDAPTDTQPTPPPAPAPVLTPQQQQQIRDLATRIASLSIPPNSPPELLTQEVKNVYNTFQITATLHPQAADEKIMQLNHTLRNIEDHRMVAQPEPQQNPAGGMFGSPV